MLITFIHDANYGMSIGKETGIIQIPLTHFQHEIFSHKPDPVPIHSLPWKITVSQTPKPYKSSSSYFPFYDTIQSLSSCSPCLQLHLINLIYLITKFVLVVSWGVESRHKESMLSLMVASCLSTFGTLDSLLPEENPIQVILLLLLR